MNKRHVSVYMHPWVTTDKHTDSEGVDNSQRAAERNRKIYNYVLIKFHLSIH